MGDISTALLSCALGSAYRARKRKDLLALGGPPYLAHETFKLFLLLLLIIIICGSAWHGGVCL